MARSLLRNPKALGAIALLPIGALLWFHLAKRAEPAIVNEPAAAASSSPSPPLPQATAAPRDPGYLGVVLARSSADVTPRFQGRLLEVLVRLGDPVKAGDIIATLDVPGLRYDLRLAEASLGAVDVEKNLAKVELSEADERLARRRALASEALATGEELSTASYQQQVAEKRVEAARARLAERRAELERLRKDNADAILRAPFDGIVAARYVDPGETVSPTTPIVRVISARDLFVRFAMPEKDVAALSMGQTVVVSSQDGRKTTRGTIDKIAPEVDAAARMVFVEARLPPAEEGASSISGEMVRVFVTRPEGP